MKLKLRETVVFSLLGAIMMVSKLAMTFLPNIHLLAVLTVVYTLVYRKKALYPIYLYVLLNGLISGFALWWYPYLYLWTVLWGVTMLLPRTMKPAVAVPVYMVVCGLHGLLFGVLYAPLQALMFRLSLRGMLAWIAAGFPFDILHGIGNFCLGTLVLPLTGTLRAAEKRLSR